MGTNLIIKFGRKKVKNFEKNSVYFFIEKRKFLEELKN
jgi:hypothetical protein